MECSGDQFIGGRNVKILYKETSPLYKIFLLVKILYKAAAQATCLHFCFSMRCTQRLGVGQRWVGQEERDSFDICCHVEVFPKLFL